MIYPSTEKFIAASAGFETAHKNCDINTRTLSKLAELHVNIAKIGVETGLAQTQFFSSINSYSDLFGLDSDLTKLFYSQFTKISEQTTDVLCSSGDEFFTLVEEMISITKTRPVDVTKTAKDTNYTNKQVNLEKKAVTKNSTKSRAVIKKGSAKRTLVRKKTN